MRRPEPTILLNKGIFNLPPYIGIVWEELAIANAVGFTQQWKSKLAEVMAWVSNHRPSDYEFDFEKIQRL